MTRSIGGAPRSSHSATPCVRNNLTHLKRLSLLLLFSLSLSLSLYLSLPKTVTRREKEQNTDGGWYCGWWQHGLYNIAYARMFGLDRGLLNAARKVAFDSVVHVPFVVFPVYYAYKHTVYDGDGAFAGLLKYRDEAQDICTRVRAASSRDAASNKMDTRSGPAPLRNDNPSLSKLGASLRTPKAFLGGGARHPGATTAYGSRRISSCSRSSPYRSE